MADWVKESNLEEQGLKIEEQLGSVAVCDPQTLEGCSEKEQAFVESMRLKPVDMLRTELKRLEGMHGSSMAPELKVWVVQRSNILTSMIATSKEL